MAGFLVCLYAIAIIGERSQGILSPIAARITTQGCQNMSMKQIFALACAAAPVTSLVAPRSATVKTCVEINQCVGCTRQFVTKSCLGDDAPVLAPSGGDEAALPRHRARAASMASRTTR